MKAMTTQYQTRFERFLGWLQKVDDHAKFHLELLDKVELALATREQTAREDRRELAEKLRRWRYQHLNEHARVLDRQHEDFIDLLELSANELLGYVARPPRQTRHAIRDATLEAGSVAEAVALLHSDIALERLIGRAAELTWGDATAHVTTAESVQRSILLYAPLYVSSDCVNYCLYCGFRYPLDIERRHLTVAEAVAQARVLHSYAFRHVLIVGGDFPSRTTTAYYQELIREICKLGITPAVEIAAQSLESYGELQSAGICGVTLYQETYNEGLYAKYHVRGPKSSFHWRLEALDRAAEAGVARLGLGILLGLADPRADLRCLMRHAAYLAHRFPDRRLAVSLPRIHKAPAGFQAPYPVSDDELIRLYCLLRIAFPQAELVLSTRESAALRNRLAKICITQMSAGSSTIPGGYDPNAPSGGEQFPVADNRSPREVADWLRAEGLPFSWEIPRSASPLPFETSQL